MPAIVGAVKVVSVSGSGVFNIGDVYQINPISTTKTFSGAGSFNTGTRIHTSTHLNQTQVMDPGAFEQNQILNI